MALAVLLFYITLTTSLQLSTISGFQTRPDNDDVLDVPSVRELINGLNTNTKRLDTVQYNEPISTGSDVKQGAFKLPGNQGEGTYSISKKEVFINLKMKLKQAGCTKPTTPPSKPPSPTTTATTIPTTATTIPTTATTIPTTANTVPTTATTIPTTASTTTPTTIPTTKPTTATTTTTPSTKPTTMASKPPHPSSNGTQECKEDLLLNKEGLAAHNKYRNIHSAPAMTLNCELSKHAAEYAQKLADLGSLVQSGYIDRPDQGENLAMDCTSGKDTGGIANEAVTNWYNEVCKYNFNEDGPQKATDHFTQLVWKASTELGMGAVNKQTNGIICTYVVARYKPQGNFNDDKTGYKDNVLKGSFKESYCNQIKEGVGLDGGYGLKRTQTG